MTPSELDRCILAAIREGIHVAQDIQYRLVVTDVMNESQVRRLRGRLQAMKNRGEIYFDRRLGGWYESD